MRNKGLLVILLLCGFIVLIGTIFMSSTNTEDDDFLIDEFYNVTQGYNSIQVERVVKSKLDKQTQQQKESGGTVNVQTWLDACIASHHMFGHAKAVFDSASIVSVNSKDVSSDSYGLFGFAAYLYGLQSDVNSLTQSTAASNSKLGQVSPSSAADLQGGDILYFDSDVEVLGNVSGDELYTITWASPETAEERYSSDNVDEHNVNSCNVGVSVKSTHSFGDIKSVYRIGSAPQGGGGGATGKVLSFPVYIQQGGQKPGYSDWFLAQDRNNPSVNSGKTVSSSGCFYCSVYMCASYYLGKVIPMDNAVPSFKDGLYINANGGYHSTSPSLYATDAMHYFGVQKSVSGDSTGTVDEVKAMIDAGNPVIYKGTTQTAVIKSSTSTHFVVIMGYDDNKQVFWVYDPGTQSHGVPREFPYSDFNNNANLGGKIRWVK